jgi:hypothetical protein
LCTMDVLKYKYYPKLQGGIAEKPSDDVEETAKLVKTLTDALPKLVPAVLNRQRRQKMDSPITADFAVTNTPAAVKQQDKRGREESAKVDEGLQPNQSILSTILSPDQVKTKSPENSATVVPQPEECSSSNPGKVSRKRKAESEESSRASKKSNCHKSDHAHKCTMCKNFKTHYMYSLKRHVRLLHPKMYKCKDCMLMLETGLLCERHMSSMETREKKRAEALEKQLKCPGCNITLVGSSELKAHASSCVKVSEEHKHRIRKSSVINLVRCKICKKSFYNQSTLEGHEKMHQERPMLGCEKCSYVSFSKKNLRAHKRRAHEKVDRHKVGLLNKIYNPVQNSSKKLFGDTSGGKAAHKELECQFCYSTFATLDSMELHCLKMHPTTFRFVCRLCPEKKRFMFQASLDKHIESSHADSVFHHLGEETTSSPDSGPYVSNDHSYASPNEKKSEELLYSEDTNSDIEWGKMIKCESCDKVFVDEATKKLHYRVFHERKSDPLPCIICNQMFNSKMVLKIHLSTCRGSKKQKARPSGDGNTSTTKSPDHDKGSDLPKMIFTCSICKEPFDDLMDHNTHLETVHSKLTPGGSGASSTESSAASASEKPVTRKVKVVVYRCNQCTEVFVAKDCVVKHLKTKHGASNVVFKSETRL